MAQVSTSSTTKGARPPTGPTRLGATTERLEAHVTRTLASARSVLVTRGRWRFPALGYALRGLKTLPPPVREPVFDIMRQRVGGALPEFRDALRFMEAAQGVPDSRMWQRRLLLERPRLGGVSTREIVADDENGRLRARLYLPPADAPDATAALVWIHGGAFLMGDLDAGEAHWVAVEVAATGIPVLSVDYRWCLNGVHFPTPLEDVLTAWHWAVEHADEMGVTPDQLHIGGASAGGCLAAGATLWLRDHDGPMPASQCLAYPVLQGDLPPASPDVAAELEPLQLLTPDLIGGMFANWAGDTPWDDPYLAPGHADPTGLPPTFVLTCGHDTLRRQSEPYADRLRRAGVPVWHELLPGVTHAPLSRVGDDDGDYALFRLRAWLGGGRPAMG